MSRLPSILRAVHIDRRGHLAAWRVVLSAGTVAFLILGFVVSNSLAQFRVPVVRVGPNVEGLEGHSYGQSVELLGRRDGDTPIELAVGDNAAPFPAVVVWDVQKPTIIKKRATVRTNYFSSFGYAIARLPDLDGDGNDEIAIGGFTHPPGEPGIPGEPGAVWIRSTRGGLDHEPDSNPMRPDGLDSFAHFGRSLCSLASLDGDSLMDLVVGAPGMDAVYLMYPDSSGRAKGYQELTFEGLASSGTDFGFSVTGLGDLDQNGIPDIAVGAPKTATGGAVYVAFLERRDSLVVRNWVEIGGPSDFSGLELETGDEFGAALSLGPDLNRDGVQDLLVGAPGDHGGGHDRGAVWVLFLKQDGTVKRHQKLSHTTSGVRGYLEDGFRFGTALEWLGDVDRDGFDDLAIGVPGAGSIWFLYGLPAYPIESVSNITQEPTVPTVGEAVSITGHWGTSVADAILQFRRAGSGQPYVQSMVTSVRLPETTGEIPPSFVTHAGTEFAIQLRFPDGNEVRSPPEGYHSFQVRVPDGLSIPVAGGTDVTSYRLISVPLDLDQPDTREILESTFGSPDPFEWRFFGQDEFSDRLVELGEREFEFVPGRAFLIITKHDAILQTGTGATVLTNPAFRVAVNPGWNLVGNPYNFDFPVSHLRLASRRPVMLRAYAEGWYAPDSLHALEGYAFWSDTADMLEFTRSPTLNVAELTPAHPDWRITLGNRFGTASDRDNAIFLHPNPFQSRLTIKYRVGTDSPVYLRIYDILGRLVYEIRGGELALAGEYSVTWDGVTASGHRASTGLYHIRFGTPKRQITGSILLVR